MFGMYYPMNNDRSYIQLNGVMPVPVLEDSDIESNVSSHNIYITFCKIEHKS